MSLTPIFVVTLVSEPILPPVAGPTFARCFAIRTIFVIPFSKIIVCRSYHRPNFCSDLKIIRLIDQRIGSVYLLIVALPAFFLAASLFLPLAFRFFAFFSCQFRFINTVENRNKRFPQSFLYQTNFTVPESSLIIDSQAQCSIINMVIFPNLRFSCPALIRFASFATNNLYHFDYTVFGIVLQEILCHDKKPGLPKENRAETYSIIISLVE